MCGSTNDEYAREFHEGSGFIHMVRVRLTDFSVTPYNEGERKSVLRL